MYEFVPLPDDVVALLREDATAQGREIGAVAGDALRNFYAVARNAPPDERENDPSKKPYPVVYFGNPDDDGVGWAPDYLHMTAEQREIALAEEREEFRRYDASRTPEQRERDRQDILRSMADGDAGRSGPMHEAIARIKAQFRQTRQAK
ncbi:MAG: hypothetical protein H7145_19985 [Akkermansiaceae bacterium]|nr:hypothetical protein [Armatimonadota bacterium]